MWWLLGGVGEQPTSPALRSSVLQLFLSLPYSVLLLHSIPAVTHRLVLKEHCISAETVVKVDSVTLHNRRVLSVGCAVQWEPPGPGRRASPTTCSP